MRSAQVWLFILIYITTTWGIIFVSLFSPMFYHDTTSKDIVLGSIYASVPHLGNAATAFLGGRMTRKMEIAFGSTIALKVVQYILIEMCNVIGFFPVLDCNIGSIFRDWCSVFRDHICRNIQSMVECFHRVSVLHGIGSDGQRSFSHSRLHSAKIRSQCHRGGHDHFRHSHCNRQRHIGTGLSRYNHRRIGFWLASCFRRHGITILLNWLPLLIMC